MFTQLRLKIIRLISKNIATLYNINEGYEKKEIIGKIKRKGENFYIEKDFIIMNPQYMEFGENFVAGQRFRIEAIDYHLYFNKKFTPTIQIGNNVTFNSDIHIGCINSILIGDNCLFASRIYITDHHHGDTTAEMSIISPNNRPLISKGPVVIENNVWVGEGVVIMPNVTIGANSIIGANAVVTKSIPANSVAVGIPAKVIKTI